MAGGSCLLGSINLSEFVTNPFKPNASFDMDKFKQAVRTGVVALNDVLNEGLELHPLQIQRENARDWRQIGLGIMGLADMFIKLGVEYGSESSFSIADEIGFALADTAMNESAVLAGKYGAFPEFDKETAFESEYLRNNCSDDTLELINRFGLRNSQILTIAPTGSISTMWGISGGVEPIFAKSYKRKTESLHGSDVYYDVYTPIVLEAMMELKVNTPPEFIKTSYDLDWQDRIRMQGIWQEHIDASISSTVNLPKSATVEDCEQLFIKAWEKGLKGVTIFREGCKRAGILTIDNDDAETETHEENLLSNQEKNLLSNSYSDDNKYQKCPECGEPIEVVQGACTICMNCGASPCS